MKRIIIRVQWVKTCEWWVAKGGDLFAECRTKTGAVARAIQRAKYEVLRGNKAQVVSHRKDGVIQWERTYGADPRRHKG